MHYCIHIFTKELPSEDKIREIIQPYNDDSVYFDEDGHKKEELTEAPPFMWDYFVIGGRYHGALKLVMRDNDEEYQWEYYSRTPREGRLFHSTLLKEIRESFVSYKAREEDWLGYMSDSTFLFVDGAKIKDIINLDDVGCYGYATDEGEAYSREQWDPSNHEFINHDDFDEKHQQMLEKYKDGFLTRIDVHD